MQFSAFFALYPILGWCTCGELGGVLHFLRFDATFFKVSYLFLMKGL
jgi:hypothetical protein